MPMVDIENPIISPWIVEIDFSRRHCDECDEQIYNNDLVYQLDGMIFCSEECLIKNLGAKVRHGWEIN